MSLKMLKLCQNLISFICLEILEPCLQSDFSFQIFEVWAANLSRIIFQIFVVKLIFEMYHLKVFVGFLNIWMGKNQELLVGYITWVAYLDIWLSFFRVVVNHI